MSIFKFKITSDFLVNSLCTVTLGVGVTEYVTNTFLNNLYVKYFKEAYKYVFKLMMESNLHSVYMYILVNRYCKTWHPK